MISAETLINIANGTLCNKRKTTVTLKRAEWQEIYKYITELREKAAAKTDPWAPEFGT